MSTWKRVVPEQSRKGDLIEHGSLECQEKIQYRWVNLNPKIDWVCVGTTKYYKQKEQVSNDYGQTWGDVIPYQYQRGASYQTKSKDCGYVPPEPIYRWTDMDISTDYICEYVPAPPTPVTPKVFMYYGGGTSYSLECNGDSTLAYAETHPSGYKASAMTYAEIGNCVTTVGRSALSNFKNLTYVTIPNSVKVIENLAFNYSTGLTRINSSVSGEVNIPNGVIRIGNNETDTDQGFGAFMDCSGITKVTIPDSTQLIGQATFQSCGNLETVVLGNNVKFIGEKAFRWCNKLSSINLPNSIEIISYQAFYGCGSLTSINLPTGLTSIDSGAFQACSGLTSIVIPDRVTRIGSNAFRSCSSLTSVTIPNRVTSIGDSAFRNCFSLTSITIPNSVTSIDDFAFDYCTGLTSVTCLASTPPSLIEATYTTGKRWFNQTNNCPIYVPASSVNAYETASGWRIYANRIRPIS